MSKDTRTVFTVSFGDVTQVLKWCHENFGPKHRKRWGHNHTMNYRTPMNLYINKKEDAMAFKLRWC